MLFKVNGENVYLINDLAHLAVCLEGNEVELLLTT